MESLVDVSRLERDDDLDSLPSTPTSDIYSDDDLDAQEEWERSLEQLQLLLTMMIVPWFGKYMGRKFAYWSKFLETNTPNEKILMMASGWARYMEWMHNVEVRWTNKKSFKAAGAIEAAATL